MVISCRPAVGLVLGAGRQVAPGAVVTGNARPGWVLTALAIAPNDDTSELEPCFADPDLLFADGFEPGDALRWSSAAP